MRASAVVGDMAVGECQHEAELSCRGMCSETDRDAWNSIHRLNILVDFSLPSDQVDMHGHILVYHGSTYIVVLHL